MGLCLDLGESFAGNLLIGLEIRSPAFCKGSSPTSRQLQMREVSERCRVFFLPTNLDQQASHSIRSLFVPTVIAACSVAIHLVHAVLDLPHSREFVRRRMVSDSLPGFQLPSGVPVSCGDGECTSTYKFWSCPLMKPWCNDDGAVPLVHAELFLKVNGGHSMLPFLSSGGPCRTLKAMRKLAQALSLPLQPRTRHCARFLRAEPSGGAVAGSDALTRPAQCRSDPGS